MTEYPDAFNAAHTLATGDFPSVSVHGRTGQVWIEDDEATLLEMTPDEARAVAESLTKAANEADG